MQRSVRFVLGVAALLGLGLAPALPARQTQQAPPPAPKEKPKPKAKRVWTEDDVKGLRKPWDEHADQKAAAEETAKAPAKPAEKAEKSATPAPAPQPEPAKFDPPKTVDEAFDRINLKREEIQGQTERIQGLRDELFNENDDAKRTELRKQIEKETALLEEAEAEMKLLEAALAELRAKAQPAAPAGATTPAPKPPSQ